MNCEALMTKNIIFCLPDDTVIKAARMMRDSNIGSIPIVDNEENRKLMGIITDRDLAIRVVGEGGDVKTIKVKEVMTKNMVTCHAMDDTKKALDLMADHQLRRIPVIDDNLRVVGIIAQADIATRLNQPEKTARVLKEISEP